jgi:site-specific DNA recombinase
LTILLSFAQFEREIISERTSDKLGAARRKGKWIGGIPVLGYDVDPQGGRLVVNEKEAGRVREIFEIADKAKTLAVALALAKARKLTTKDWTSRKGTHHEGRWFEKGRLRALLGNVLYIGSIRHKGTVYPGEHVAIVDQELWERVNEQLARNGRHQQGRPHEKQKALLTGLIHCGQCRSRRSPYY